ERGASGEVENGAAGRALRILGAADVEPRKIELKHRPVEVSPGDQVERVVRGPRQRHASLLREIPRTPGTSRSLNPPSNATPGPLSDRSPGRQRFFARRLSLFHQKATTFASAVFLNEAVVMPAAPLAGSSGAGAC